MKWWDSLSVKATWIRPLLWLSCPKAKAAQLKAAETVKSEYSLRPSQLVWSSRHVCSHRFSTAASLLHCSCLDKCGRRGENLPGSVQYRGRPHQLRKLAGIMGLQHQHHRRERGQNGEDSNCYFKSTLKKKRKTNTKKTKQKNAKTEIVRVGIRCVCFYVHQSAAGKRWSDFYANKSKEAEKFNISTVTDPEIKLQLISLQDKGSTVLPADKAEKVARRFGFCSNYERQYVSQNEKNLHINFTILGACL